MRCDVIAAGVINAAKTIGMKKPIVIRLQGTNVEQANELIANWSVSFVCCSTHMFVFVERLKHFLMFFFLHLAFRGQMMQTFSSAIIVEVACIGSNNNFFDISAIFQPLYNICARR